MTAPKFTPWFDRFNTVAWFTAGDAVIAEHHADTAVDSDDDDDAQFAVDMANMHAQRAAIFRRRPCRLGTLPDGAIEQQTRNALAFNPDNPWPADTAGAQLTVWKSHL